MNVRFHPATLAELRGARDWYFERSPLTATAFAHTIANAISRIVEAPTRCPLAEHGMRRLVLHRFPFHIFYFADDAEIVIVAVAHQKRRPGYWSSRVPPP